MSKQKLWGKIMRINRVGMGWSDSRDGVLRVFDRGLTEKEMNAMLGLLTSKCVDFR